MKTLLAALCCTFFVGIKAQEILPANYQELLIRANERPGKKTNRQLAKMRKKNANDPWIYWISGIAVSDQNVNQEIAYYQKAIAVDSCFVRAYYNWATVLPTTSEEEMQRVFQLLDRCTSCNSDFGYAYTMKAELYLLQHNYPSALASAKQAATCSQTDLLGANYVELKALYAMNDTITAHARLRELNLVEQLNFWPPPMSVFIGNLYYDMKDTEAACLCWNHALEIGRLFEEEPTESLLQALKNCP